MKILLRQIDHGEDSGKVIALEPKAGLTIFKINGITKRKGFVFPDFAAAKKFLKGHKISYYRGWWNY